MGWLLLAAFPAVMFAIQVETGEQCQALARMNRENSQGAIMVCMPKCASCAFVEMVTG